MTRLCRAVLAGVALWAATLTRWLRAGATTDERLAEIDDFELAVRDALNAANPEADSFDWKL